MQGPSYSSSPVLQLNSSITHLSLEDNAIGADGLAKLVKGLRGSCHIQELVSLYSYSVVINVDSHTVPFCSRISLTTA